VHVVEWEEPEYGLKRFSTYSKEVRLEVKILPMLSFGVAFSIKCNLNIAECKLHMYY
jgi:hypothetical protein